MWAISYGCSTIAFVARDFFNRPCQFTLPLAHNINFGGFGWHKINYGENCFAEKKLNPAENVINSDRNTQKKFLASIGGKLLVTSGVSTYFR